MDLNRPLGGKIQINVGNSKYHIHEEPLRRNTESFNYEHRSVMNIDVGSEVFESFVQWLYNRDLFKHPAGGARVILKLWFFAAKISCPELQKSRIQDTFFETPKDGGEHIALESFCAAMLRQESTEDCFTIVRDFLQAVPVALATMTMTRSASPNQMFSRICASIASVNIFESFDSLEIPSEVLGFATTSMTNFKQLVWSIHTARERRSFICDVLKQQLRDNEKMNSTQRSGLAISREKIRVEVIGGCYEIHEELLAGTGLFERLKDDQAIIPDEESDTFDYLVQWLYTPGHFFKVPKIKTVLKLWILADGIEFPRLQNYCMDFLQNHYRRNDKFTDLDELKCVFGATEGVYMAGNLLMKLCVAQLHFQNNSEGSTAVTYFLRTVPTAIVAYLDYETWFNVYSDNDPRSREKFPCEFHVHDTNEDREDCQIKLE
ncbi:uncharacterized protein Bfra_002716 [Botrytis fragariae]|uniref:BTB domain-containing protein n=1 Tax=Botrytis fragariae TaxID=1964551 RepID=A0A8H6AZE7_9HELO|nr:uncharacterized protein Bfra_002716 [Botrytis fragariae]KAF5876312.1 hypothetical protein Bfra_002716 [Botrytis fragariae]